MDERSFEDSELDIPAVLPFKSYNEIKAKQRASILWLVSKAYNHRIPSDLREPCYRDHEGEERLKPQIIHSLANAELYCLALANIYADPNYHNLNHIGIIQLLMRKGVDVIEPPDASLTETVLVQTAPIKMSAHMAVIESIMALYIKEVLIPEKVMEVISRFSVIRLPIDKPIDAKHAALLWINKSCVKMRHRIEEELGSYRSPGETEVNLEDYRLCCTAICRKPTLHNHTFLQTDRHVVPCIPIAQDLNDLSDGCCLAALLCFYCPGYLNWQDVRLSDSPSLADSVYNLQLVQRFCQEYLPHDIHFLTLEDFIYLHSSVHQNILALIADLMYLFEIRPAKCVNRPGIREEIEQSLVLEAPKRLSQNGQSPQVISKPRSFRHTKSPIPDLRSGAFGGSNFSLPDINRSSPQSNGNWQQREKMTGSKLSSNQIRRINSMSDSRKTLHDPQDVPATDRLEEDEELAGYFVDELPSTHEFRDQKISGHGTGYVSPSTLHLESTCIIDSDQIREPLLPTHIKKLKEKNNHDTKRQERGEDYIRPSEVDFRTDDRNTDIKHQDSELNNQGEIDEHEDENLYEEIIQRSEDDDGDDVQVKAGLQDYYSQLGTEYPKENDIYEVIPHQKSWHDKRVITDINDSVYDKEKAVLEIADPYDNLYEEVKNLKGLTTSFADLCKLKKSPSNAINIVYMQTNNMNSNNKPPAKSNPLGSDSAEKNQDEQDSSNKSNSYSRSNVAESDASIQSQMYNIRLKLEERRKKIEKEKKRIENIWRHQRQRLGKAAFLQAVTKGTVSEASTPDSNAEKELPVAETEVDLAAVPVVQESIQDIAEDLNLVKKQWLLQNGSSDKLQKENISKSGQLDMNVEEFQTSIEQLNNSLTDLQTDIANLSSQQDMIQKMMNTYPSQSQQEEKFFLHNQQGRTQDESLPVNQSPWRNQPYTHLSDTPTSPRRGQWGHAVTHIPEQPQRQQWQPAPPVIRPSSVEPQMMTGHSIPMQTQQYDQRPPSAAPFIENSHQGFTLHPSRSDMYSTYDYRLSQPQPQSQPPSQPHSMYHNGPMENVSLNQYGYSQYANMPSHSYSSLQNIPQDQYKSMMYTTPSIPQPVHNYPQNSSHPFHLQQEPTHPMSMPPTSQYQSYPTFTRSQGEMIKQQFEKALENNSSAQDDDIMLLNVTDEFGRPVGSAKLSSSPPNKPVLGKTFRISKPKITSPPPNRGESPPPPPPNEADQNSQPSTQASNDTGENDKGFYISFDDNQPRKPKPKLRPRQVKARQQQRRAEIEAANGHKETTNYDSPQGSSGTGDTTSPSTESVKTSPGQQNAEANNQPGVGFVIGADFVSPNPDAELEMARRKEMIMMMSLRRRAEQESKRIKKEQEYAWQREQERMKKEIQEKKKEEEKLRRQMILEQYRHRKAQEAEEKEGGGSASKEYNVSNSRTGTLTRPKTRSASATRPRPKSIHVGSGSHDSLASNLGTGNNYHDDTASVHSLDIPSPRKSAGGTSRNLLSPTQSGGHFPGHPPLPLNLLSARYKGSGPPSDGASDTNSTTSSVTAAEYTGPKLFVKPTTKSNRGIIVNAINTVLAGAVNNETKKRVLEEINRSDSKHFLILFRDAGCQYRAIYSYNPDTEEVFKLNGIGPKLVTDHMMDRFFKYNSGGKCFTEVHTKHLTVTIDAFTIHNSLWAGKKVVPPKKDFF
ncbi:LOW QUALITY PROTEIN: patronin [Centruroides vittatus]|uniref:LOW QUALITY PROTEIN: patronin n=1 Tax=Centruroides vittatus TaxID=120091 RepID=UPI00350FBD34